MCYCLLNHPRSLALTYYFFHFYLRQCCHFEDFKRVLFLFCEHEKLYKWLLAVAAASDDGLCRKSTVENSSRSFWSMNFSTTVPGFLPFWTASYRTSSAALCNFKWFSCDFNFFRFRNGFKYFVEKSFVHCLTARTNIDTHSMFQW